MPAIASETCLRDVLYDDESAFDRLVCHQPVYRKFAKVLLQERIAESLTLADVANMAGIPVRHVIDAVSGLPAGEAPPPALPIDPPPEESAAWLVHASETPRRFDARPLLEAGHEPLRDLLDFVGSASAGAVLAIDAPFHPVPLRRLLEGRGYESAAECVSSDHWRILVRRRPAPVGLPQKEHASAPSN